MASKLGSIENKEMLKTFNWYWVNFDYSENHQRCQ